MKSFYVELARDSYLNKIVREGYKVKYFDLGGAEAHLLESNNEQIIVFRGTDDIYDLHCIIDGFDGFMMYAYGLASVIELNKNKPLVLVGHSLGGAIAVCYASVIKHNNAVIHSYGCPKIGSFNFVKTIKHIKHNRYVAEYDHVPYLPFGYVHHGTKIKLNSKFTFKNHQIDTYVNLINQLEK